MILLSLLIMSVQQYLVALPLACTDLMLFRCLGRVGQKVIGNDQG